MKKRIKEKIETGCAWALIIMFCIAVQGLFWWMMFGWVFEIGQFHQIMGMLAG